MTHRQNNRHQIGIQGASLIQPCLATLSAVPVLDVTVLVAGRGLRLDVSRLSVTHGGHHAHHIGLHSQRLVSPSSAAIGAVPILDVTILVAGLIHSVHMHDVVGRILVGQFTAEHAVGIAGIEIAVAIDVLRSFFTCQHSRHKSVCIRREADIIQPQDATIVGTVGKTELINSAGNNGLLSTPMLHKGRERNDIPADKALVQRNGLIACLERALDAILSDSKHISTSSYFITSVCTSSVLAIQHEGGVDLGRNLAGRIHPEYHSLFVGIIGADNRKDDNRTTARRTTVPLICVTAIGGGSHLIDGTGSIAFKDQRLIVDIVSIHHRGEISRIGHNAGRDTLGQTADRAGLGIRTGSRNPSVATQRVAIRCTADRANLRLGAGSIVPGVDIGAAMLQLASGGQSRKGLCILGKAEVIEHKGRAVRTGKAQEQPVYRAGGNSQRTGIARIPVVDRNGGEGDNYPTLKAFFKENTIGTINGASRHRTVGGNQGIPGVGGGLDATVAVAIVYVQNQTTGSGIGAIHVPHQGGLAGLAGLGKADLGANSVAAGRATVKEQTVTAEAGIFLHIKGGGIRDDSGTHRIKIHHQVVVAIGYHTDGIALGLAAQSAGLGGYAGGRRPIMRASSLDRDSAGRRNNRHRGAIGILQHHTALYSISRRCLYILGSQHKAENIAGNVCRLLKRNNRIQLFSIHIGQFAFQQPLAGNKREGLRIIGTAESIGHSGNICRIGHRNSKGQFFARGCNRFGYGVAHINRCIGGILGSQSRNRERHDQHQRRQHKGQPFLDLGQLYHSFYYFKG